MFNKKFNGEYIQILDCQGFSIGSGPITVWASGQSGWFEIRPSEAYQAMYNNMTEAITLYYFLTELYEDLKARAQRGSHKSLSIDKILFKVRAMFWTS